MIDSEMLGAGWVGRVKASNLYRYLSRSINEVPCNLSNCTINLMAQPAFSANVSSNITEEEPAIQPPAVNILEDEISLNINELQVQNQETEVFIFSLDTDREWREFTKPPRIHKEEWDVNVPVRDATGIVSQLPLEHGAIPIGWLTAQEQKDLVIRIRRQRGNDERYKILAYYQNIVVSGIDAMVFSSDFRTLKITYRPNAISKIVLADICVINLDSGKIEKLILV